MKKRWIIIFSLIICFSLLFSCRKPDDWISLGSFGISPNGDNINDVLKLPFDTTKANKMTILDTKSQKVILQVCHYEKNYWNGKLRNTGPLVPSGLYNFYLEIEGSFTYYGFVYVKY